MSEIEKVIEEKVEEKVEEKKEEEHTDEGDENWKIKFGEMIAKVEMLTKDKEELYRLVNELKNSQKEDVEDRERMRNYLAEIEIRLSERLQKSEDWIAMIEAEEMEEIEETEVKKETEQAEVKKEEKEEEEDREKTEKKKKKRPLIV